MSLILVFISEIVMYLYRTIAVLAKYGTIMLSVILIINYLEKRK